jgi:hypothetical protein
MRVITLDAERLLHRCGDQRCFIQFSYVPPRCSISRPADVRAVGSGRYRPALRAPRRATSAPVRVEPMTGIEPAYSAWEVFSTPEQVSGNCWSAGCCRQVSALVNCNFGTSSGLVEYGYGTAPVRLQLRDRYGTIEHTGDDTPRSVGVCQYAGLHEQRARRLCQRGL